MSAEDLERYETEIELQLYKEYRDVLPMFSYVVETERRFYLTNQVKLDARNEQGQVYFELELHDAWVWDMYRPARFVANVRVVTFKDVNIEELAGNLRRGSRSPGARSATPARTPSPAGTRRQATRSSTATGAAARESSTSWSRATGLARVLRGEDAPYDRVRLPRRSGDGHQAAPAAHPGDALARRAPRPRVPARCASTWRRCSRRAAASR